ncbi:MAG: alpha/beta fold hydrolase [Opitutaceae bacterium]
MRSIKIIGVSGFLFLLGGCAAIQRKFLFFPTHHTRTNGLVPWVHEGKTIGYSRQVSSPKNVWLMLHGNGGQAADRAETLPAFSERDAVFILEYPGYGGRAGKPSKAALDQAAVQAYRILRTSYPGTPIGVIGESLGSGPASMLAKQATPPEKIVLVVPFDHLARVAAHHMPFMPVRLILGSTWDNLSSLSGYQGQLEIFGAKHDTVIPLVHAKALAEKLPSAKFHVIDRGHNEWVESREVAFRIP